MDKDTRALLLAKKMTRREFLQVVGGSLLILFGLGNVIAVLTHVKKIGQPTQTKLAQNEAIHGFGARKFGV